MILIARKVMLVALVHAAGRPKKASVVATPTLVTIRKLREAYGHTRSKRSHEG